MLAFLYTGKILEGEKFLKFQKMNTRTRKKFFLTDERIIRMNLMKLKSKKQHKNKAKVKKADWYKDKNKFLYTRISSVENLYEFALMVLGITDSYELYRTLLWMSKGPKYHIGKWRQWFKAKYLPKASFLKKIGAKFKQFDDLENR